MAKALPFPVHKHPPSTRDPKLMLRIGALTNDQGSEGSEPGQSENGAESDDEAATDESTGAAIGAADAGGAGPPPENQPEGAAPPAGPPTEGGPGKY